MADLQTKNRLDWNDADWATYLGCSVAQVMAYKIELDKHYIPTIERDKKTGKYSFALYRYNISPSGFKRLQLLLSDNRAFDDIEKAMNKANEIISTFELSDTWAKMLHIPKKAIQMLLIREK